MTHQIRIILTGVLALLIPGCGNSTGTYPVEGRVVFADGSPVTDGTIEFETMNGRKAVTAASEIGPDGGFTLGTFASGDGALPGKHRVAVIADYQIGTEMERPEVIPQPTIDNKYRSFKTSGLTFVVERDMNLFQVTVDRPSVEKSKTGEQTYSDQLNE